MVVTFNIKKYQNQYRSSVENLLKPSKIFSISHLYIEETDNFFFRFLLLGNIKNNTLSPSLG